MKATSIYGGVQIFNIVIQIIKSKIVAVLLGPTGMGLMGLYTSTTSLVKSATDLGLGTSAVRYVAENRSDSEMGTAKTVVQKWFFVTGMIGFLATLLLAPILSQFTFGTRDHTLAFVWISVTLLISQVSSGQLVLLQGLQKRKYLANANATGAVIGLIISIPLYYLWGIDGIVPSIIMVSLANMFRSWYFTNKLKIDTKRISYKEIFDNGKDMARVGISVSITFLLTMASFYIIRVYINAVGGIDQVGLYNAGFAMLNSYVGMVFTAMGTDYLPRLSKVISLGGNVNQTIIHQAEIILLLITPLLLLIIIFSKPLVSLLYSKEFIPIISMLRWASLGMLFRAVSWPLSFMFLATGSGKLLLLNETFTKLYSVSFNILGYYWGGLAGLGISFFITNALYSIQVMVVVYRKYKIKYSKSYVLLLLFQLIMTLGIVLIMQLQKNMYVLIISYIVLIISIFTSIVELDKRLNIRQILKGK